MSWQLGAFAVLLAGLAAGFAWYERMRPDSRTVALVGVLAALGALGRIAFAPLPNVKPTTDIVLIAGFALGGAPGYMVGALSALTSNFFFGQGPWTPWQMAGWGAVGVAGALLARITRGRIGRLRLALICFPIGFAFTALQDAGGWVTFSDHSLAQLGVYVGKGAVFDLIHACGCFAFALAFGPGLIAALRRFRMRLEVTWLPSSTAGGPLAAALIAAVLSLAILAPRAPSAARAAEPHHPTQISYLLHAQNRDGGFGMAPGQPSNPLASAWAAIALAWAPGRSARPVQRDRAKALSYLAKTLARRPDPGSLERMILALNGSHPIDPGYHGASLVLRLTRLIASNGSVSEQSNLTAFAILALRAAHASVPVRAVAWLARQQDRDGGFNYSTRGAASDVDDTAAAVQALAGTTHAGGLARAVAFIRAHQNRDGGFPSTSGGPSNAQSTAFAVQGLLAAHVKPATVHRHASASPIQYLKSLTQPNGAVAYATGNRQTPVWVTAQAQLALAGQQL